MKSYKIKINTHALSDIREATVWYNKQVPKLGSRFQKEVIKQINKLASNATGFSLRYAEVRCMVIKDFPFLVHFKIDHQSNTVEVFAVLHTSRSPKIWEQRNPKL